MYQWNVQSKNIVFNLVIASNTIYRFQTTNITGVKTRNKRKGVRAPGILFSPITKCCAQGRRLSSSGTGGSKATFKPSMRLLGEVGTVKITSTVVQVAYGLLYVSVVFGGYSKLIIVPRDKFDLLVVCAMPIDLRGIFRRNF